MELDRITQMSAFADMIGPATGLFFWHYSKEMKLLSTSCKDAESVDNLFSVKGCKDAVLSVCRGGVFPVIVTDPLSLSWLAVPMYQGRELKNVFLLGPCFSSYTTEEMLFRELEQVRLPEYQKLPLVRQLEKFPVVPHNALIYFGRMLYYCITQQSLQSRDIRIYTCLDDSRYQEQAEKVSSIRGMFAFEQAYFSAVTHGDLSGLDQLPVPDPSRLGQMVQDNPIRQAKNQNIVKITLATRAAITGGLPEELAFAISDRYIQKLEDCTKSIEAYECGQQCFVELTQRVHELKLRSNVNLEVQRCIAYLELRTTSKIDYQEMAKTLGYNRQYLSAKFRREMGCTIGEYMTGLRIDRAKTLLRNSDRSISEISQMLQFSSSSHFGVVFRKMTGVTPGEYRDSTTDPPKEGTGHETET